MGSELSATRGDGVDGQRLGEPWVRLGQSGLLLIFRTFWTSALHLYPIQGVPAVPGGGREFGGRSQ